MRKTHEDSTILSSERGGPSSGIPRSASASDDPSIRAEVADLSIDARNTGIANDQLAAASDVTSQTTSARRRLKNLKSKQSYSSGGSTGGSGDRSSSGARMSSGRRSSGVSSSTPGRLCPAAVPPGGWRRRRGVERQARAPGSW